MNSPILEKIQAKAEWERSRVTDAVSSATTAAGRQLEPVDGVALVLVGALQREQYAKDQIAKLDEEIDALRKKRGGWVRELGRCKERAHRAREAIGAIR